MLVMTKVSCNVVNCVFSKEGLCTAEEIILEECDTSDYEYFNEEVLICITADY